MILESLLGDNLIAVVRISFRLGFIPSTWQLIHNYSNQLYPSLLEINGAVCPGGMAGHPIQPMAQM